MTIRGVTLFIHLLLLPVTHVWAQNADVNVLRYVNGNRSPAMNSTMSLASGSVLPVALGAPLAEATIGYFTHRHQLNDNALQHLAAAGIAGTIAVSMKNCVSRERPHNTYPFITAYMTESSPSFPSAHTSVAFATATSVSMCHKRWYVVVPAFTWASAVGYSRMYEGVHYPSDVLAGAALGVGSAWLAHKGTAWLHGRHHLHMAKAEAATSQQ